MADKINKAFRIFSQHWGLFACLVLSLWLPANLVINILDFQVFAEDDYFSALRLGMLLDGTIGALPLAAVLMSLLRFEHGESVTYSSAMYDGVRRFIRVIVVNLCAGILVVAIGFIAFLVLAPLIGPGGQSRPSLSVPNIWRGMLGIFFAVCAIYLFLRLALINVAVVTENLGPIAGMNRSFQATKGILLPIVFIGAISYPLIFFIGFVLYLPLLILDFIESMIPPTWFQILYGSLVDSTTDVLMVIPTILFFLYYRDRMWMTQS